MSGIFGIIVNNGNHPKHKIINYFEWFIKNISKEDIVIDIGCNKGYMAKIIANKAKFVYGIEIIEEMITVANKVNKSENLIFFNADATNFNYSKLKFKPTVVTLSNVLEHIDDRISFLNKLKQNLGSNIKFLIRVPMIDRDWIVLYKKEMGLDYRLDKTHFIEYTYLKFEDEIMKSKLEIVKYDIRWGELYAIVIPKTFK
jgi:2-polyprenyl-3-methyl-5-hydroxy-6-metoxy-1,4-benzoquinol methylase